MALVKMNQEYQKDSLKVHEELHGLKEENGKLAQLI